MSISSDLLKQIDDLLSSSVDVDNSNISSPYLQQKDVIFEDYDIYDENENTLVNKYKQSDSSDISSIESDETERTSIQVSFHDKILLGESAKSDTTIIHRKLTHKHENLNNILDCLEDMIHQETRTIEEELLNFVTDLRKSVPYNSYNIELTNYSI